MNNLPPLPSVAQLRPVGRGAAVLTRRKFLVYSAAGLVSMSLLPAAASLAATAGSQDIEERTFNRLCQFLTGKELQLSLTQRAFSALNQVDKEFGRKATALAMFIKNGQFASIETLKVAAELKDELRATALNIIASLYLGYAGTARPDHAEDDTQFVTYTEALMYRLTYDYTPIPSYSRWSTGYWTSVPK